MTHETVDLTRVAGYWRRLGKLPAALAALVTTDDATLYIAWWCRASGGSVAAAENHVVYLRALIADLRVHGYRPEAYRDDPRGFDYARAGHGPITVIRATSGYAPRDGAHRACILRALGRPIPARIWSAS